jgi:hypothetical protein
VSAINTSELLAAVRQIDSLRAEVERQKAIVVDMRKLNSKVIAERDALRAEIENRKSWRVHDVEEKEWLRDQMIALRAVLRDLYALVRKQGMDDGFLLKVGEADWHGVSDAANDLRVMEAKYARP